MSGRAGLVFALVVALALGAGGCAFRELERPFEGSETEIQLSRAPFQTLRVHVKGRASCQYLLFVPLCARQDLASVAWRQMRKQAAMEGEPAQLINIREDQFDRWNLLGLYYQEVYTVSADVIAFD